MAARRGEMSAGVPSRNMSPRRIDLGVGTRITTGAAIFFAIFFFIAERISWGKPAAGHVALVYPMEFAPALQRWVDYRTRQGYTIHPIPIRPEQTPIPSEWVREQLATLAAESPLDALLIIGDAAPTSSDPNEWRRIVPAPRLSARVISEFGPENHIASDNVYADLDGDGLPELAVGRIPVTSGTELQGVIEKIIRYETRTPAGVWQRSIRLVAGVGGFTPVVDFAIEKGVQNLLAETIPDTFETSFVQGNWQSAYCPDPQFFRYTVLDQINRGPLFWAYMGHATHRQLDRLVTPVGDFAVFESEDRRHIDCRDAAPILFFFACYAGAFDAAESSLAEELSLLPHGPIAVVAASRTTMPYAMAVFAVEALTQSLAADESAPLGFILRDAKRCMVPLPHQADTENLSHQKVRRSLDATAKLFDPTAARLPDQLADHRDLFHLFGDPLLGLRLPEKLRLEVSSSPESPRTLTVSGSMPPTRSSAPGRNGATARNGDSAPGTFSAWSPESGDDSPLALSPNRGISHEAEVLVELTLPLNRRIGRATLRKEFSLDDADRIAWQQTFEAANQRVILSATGQTHNGAFSLEITLPNELSGECILRAICWNADQAAVGSARVSLRGNRVSITPSPDH